MRKTRGDLLAVRDKIAELHWNDTKTFTRDEVWNLLELISDLESEIESWRKYSNMTLTEAIERMHEEYKT